jgi:hypothetical protein
MAASQLQISLPEDIPQPMTQEAFLVESHLGVPPNALCAPQPIFRPEKILNGGRNVIHVSLYKINVRHKRSRPGAGLTHHQRLLPDAQQGHSMPLKIPGFIAVNIQRDFRPPGQARCGGRVDGRVDARMQRILHAVDPEITAVVGEKPGIPAKELVPSGSIPTEEDHVDGPL